MFNIGPDSRIQVNVQTWESIEQMLLTFRGYRYRRVSVFSHEGESDQTIHHGVEYLSQIECSIGTDYDIFVKIDNWGFTTVHGAAYITFSQDRSTIVLTYALLEGYKVVDTITIIPEG